MKDSPLVQEEDSTRKDTMESRLKEYMGLFKDVDLEGDEEYVAYFTDGKDMFVYETCNTDKYNAEWALEQVLFHHWLKKTKKMQGNEGTDCDEGLSASVRSAIAKNYSTVCTGMMGNGQYIGLMAII